MYQEIQYQEFHTMSLGTPLGSRKVRQVLMFDKNIIMFFSIIEKVRVRE